MNVRTRCARMANIICECLFEVFFFINVSHCLSRAQFAYIEFTKGKKAHIQSSCAIQSYKQPKQSCTQLFTGLAVFFSAACVCMCTCMNTNVVSNGLNIERLLLLTKPIQLHGKPHDARTDSGYNLQQIGNNNKNITHRKRRKMSFKHQPSWYGVEYLFFCF